MPYDDARVQISADAKKVCFVLSAGRTGSVFLAELIQREFPEVVSLHEPFPARYELLLANLRNDTGLGASALRRVFTWTRYRRFNRLSKRTSYIEFNPLLCPLCDLLPQLPVPLDVVHLVREPLSWAHSITAFRASKRFRWLIDHVPFAKPYPHPRPPGWSQLDELERALWRWRFCNERIRALRSHCRRYLVIRYEDLFASDPAQRAGAFDELLAFLPVDCKAGLEVDTANRANAAPKVGRPGDPSRDKVRSICGPLMADFGYDG